MAANSKCKAAATNQPIVAAALQDLIDEWPFTAAQDRTTSPALPWLLVRPSCHPCHTCCLAAFAQRPHLHAEKNKTQMRRLLDHICQTSSTLSFLKDLLLR